MGGRWPARWKAGSYIWLEAISGGPANSLSSFAFAFSGISIPKTGRTALGNLLDSGSSLWALSSLLDCRPQEQSRDILCCLRCPRSPSFCRGTTEPICSWECALGHTFCTVIYPRQQQTACYVHSSSPAQTCSWTLLLVYQPHSVRLHRLPAFTSSALTDRPGIMCPC